MENQPWKELSTMGDAGFFKGTSADQDSRFSNKEKKLLKSMTFPPEFEEKVDVKKVNLDVMKPWMTERITQLLGFEDEVVIDFAFGLLEENQFPDPKRMQINLTGFLEGNTQLFVLELWRLLLSAQESVGGIPKVFLEKKKDELRQKKEKDAILAAERNSVMDEIRKRKRDEEQDYKGDRRNDRRNDRRRDDRRDRRDRSYDRRDRSRDRRDRRDRSHERRDRRDRSYDRRDRSYDHRDRRDRSYDRRDRSYDRRDRSYDRRDRSYDRRDRSHDRSDRSRDRRDRSADHVDKDDKEVTKPRRSRFVDRG